MPSTVLSREFSYYTDISPQLFRAIYTGPASYTINDFGKEDIDSYVLHYVSRLPKGSKATNAENSSIQHVTPGSIAYVMMLVRASYLYGRITQQHICCQIYFALSNETQFRSLKPGPVQETYKAVQEFFLSKVPAIQTYAAELLEWWTRYVHVNLSNFFSYINALSSKISKDTDDNCIDEEGVESGTL